jgi:hypothetical protein
MTKPLSDIKALLVKIGAARALRHGFIFISDFCETELPPNL